MFWHRLCRMALGFVIGLSCLSPSLSKAADQGDVELHVGSWEGAKSKVRGITICFLLGPDAKGVLLSAVRTEKNGQFLGFHNDSWTLKDEGAYDVVLIFDGRQRFSVKAVVAGKEGVNIDMPVGSDIEQAFRSASSLRLEAAKQSYTFALRGSSDVLDRLAQCSGTARAPTKAPTVDPAPSREPSATSGPKNGPLSPTPYLPQQEVHTVADQVTLGTFMTDVTWIAPQDATPETIRWQAKEANGSVSILTYNDQTPTPEQAAQSLLTLATASCEGTFEGKITPQKALKETLQVVSMRCLPPSPTSGNNASGKEASEEQTTVIYYVAARPRGGVYVYRLAFKDPPPQDAEPLPGLYTALAVSAHSAKNTP